MIHYPCSAPLSPHGTFPDILADQVKKGVVGEAFPTSAAGHTGYRDSDHCGGAARLHPLSIGQGGKPVYRNLGNGRERQHYHSSGHDCTKPAGRAEHSARQKRMPWRVPVCIWHEASPSAHGPRASSAGAAPEIVGPAGGAELPDSRARL